jgi:hypothetical protein
MKSASFKTQESDYANRNQVIRGDYYVQPLLVYYTSVCLDKPTAPAILGLINAPTNTQKRVEWSKSIAQ